MADETTTEIGAVLPDGSVDWNAADTFGAIDTPASRASYAEQYALRLSALGVTVQPVSFVSRQKTTTYSDSTPIVDPPASDPNATEPATEATP